MITPRQCRIWIPGSAILMAGTFFGICQWRAIAQPGPAPGANRGPDVIVGDIPSVVRWGSLGSESAFSIATTSCNIGDQRLDWIASPASNVHPVITQNLYRIDSGGIQQIGTVSWLKHGFAVAAGNVCGTCNDPAFNYLGVNCSDPYGAGLNGTQSGLGPRSEINAATGDFPVRFRELPLPRTVLDGRMRVANADLEPTLNDGARYFVESQYVHPQDAAAGNGLNNASHREVFVEVNPGGELQLRLRPSSPIVRQQPAILAWAAADPLVTVKNFDIPGDGRIIMAIRTIPLFAGDFLNLIALQNLNSHASVRSLKIEFADGQVTNPEFHDIHYQHERYSGDDWRPTVAGSTIEWATETFTQNENANALRWGSMYSFRCNSQTEPKTVKIGLFRPGSSDPDAIQIVKADERPMLAPPDAPGRWAAVGQNIDLGTIKADGASFTMSASPGRKHAVKTVQAAGAKLTGTSQESKDKKRNTWQITLKPEADAPAGYFESIVTITPQGDQKPVTVRVYGNIEK